VFSTAVNRPMHSLSTRLSGVDGIGTDKRRSSELRRTGEVRSEPSRLLGCGLDGQLAA
jgi:hypothetical protein